MEIFDSAMDELDHIVKDACDGKLTEATCQKRLEEFKAKFGDSWIQGSPLGDIKNEPASKEKLRNLQRKRAQGRTSEEIFVEMARTGRKLRQKKIICMVAAIAAIVAIIVVIIALISALKS